MTAKIPGIVRKSRRACPKCGSRDIVPIRYGLPGPEMTAAADRGEIELGGCCVANDDPTLYCKACKERFGAPKRRR